MSLYLCLGDGEYDDDDYKIKITLLIFINFLMERKNKYGSVKCNDFEVVYLKVPLSTSCPLSLTCTPSMRREPNARASPIAQST